MTRNKQKKWHTERNLHDIKSLVRHFKINYSKCFSVSGIFIASSNNNETDSLIELDETDELISVLNLTSNFNQHVNIDEDIIRKWKVQQRENWKKKKKKVQKISCTMEVLVKKIL